MRHSPTSSLALGLFFLCLPLSGQTAFAAGTSLLDSVEAAISYNPELKAGQERRQAAGHAVDKARAGFFPSIAAEGSAGFSRRSDAGIRSFHDDKDMRSYGDAGVRLIQPLFQGGYTAADVAVRRAQHDSADSQLEDSATSLAFQAITSHVEVLRRAELVVLAKNNVTEHAEILMTVRKRLGGQIATVGELHQVEGRHARALATLSSYEAALDAAHAAYLNVTGKAAKNLEPAEQPGKVYARLEEAFQASLNGNRRIQAAIQEVVAAGGEKDMAKSRFYPSINLEAGPSWHDRDNRGYGWVTDMGVGLRMRWDILSGGEDVANVAMAGARIRQARHNLHMVMDSLGRDIEATYSLYLHTLEQIGMYDAARRASRLAREDYYRQFLSAQRSLLDVLDAENDYFYAAGQQVMSRGDRVIAGYRLLALGGDLLAGLGVDASRLRVQVPTSSEAVNNLRGAFPTQLRNSK